MQYIIMCRSLTYAQRASRLLERSGIYAGLTKAPQGVTPEGCTFGVRIAAKNLTRALGILKTAGINTGKIFEIRENGEIREVAR